jgi:hypothetical protein
VQLDLPDRLRPGRGVDGDGGVDEVGLLDVGDLAPPHVEVGQEGPAGGECRRGRPVRLVGVRRVLRPARLGQQRVELQRPGAVVLGHQAVDVHPAAADCQRAGREGDLEGVRRRTRDDRDVRGTGGQPGTVEVGSLGPQPPVQQVHQLVPVGVEQ